MTSVASVTITPPRVYHPSSAFNFSSETLSIPQPDLKVQSVPVPGSAQPGFSPIYRNVRAAGGLIGSIDATKYKTLYDNFNLGLSRGQGRPCIGHRPWDPVNKVYANDFYWQTYEEVAIRRNNFGAGLLVVRDQVGLLNSKEGKVQGWTDKLPGPEGFTVGIWSQNRPEWFIVDVANHAYNNVTVALYDTLGADSTEYVMEHSSVTVLVASSARAADALTIAKKLPTLKAIIVMDDIQETAPGEPTTVDHLKRWGQTVGLRVYGFGEVEALGLKTPRSHIPPQAADLASICYTSGTTGNPKGALLTHRALLGAAHASSSLVDLSVSAPRKLISYLPLAHIYERNVEAFWVSAGMAIGYFHGDLLGIVDDIQILKPYFFPSVPRLLNRVVSGVKTKIEVPGLKGALVKKALADKLYNLERGSNRHLFWDALIFPKIRAALGGNVGLIVSGAAPISGDVLSFIKIAFRTEAIEGYGATETCAVATVQLPGDNVASIGPPAHVCEVRLRDIPEMNYVTSGNLKRGELLIRGFNIFSGYYKDPEKTAEALDKDGWYHSGDVGSIDESGRVRIVDRVKNIYKLGQGEYVAPENLEVKLQNQLPVIAQIFIHGDSLRNHLVAIIVPEPERFAVFAGNILGQTITATDLGALNTACNHPKVLQAFVDEIERAGRALKFAGFEVPRQVHLLMDPFAGELVTPSFKVKRNVASAHFKSVIDKLYNSYKEKSSAGGAGDIGAKL